MAIDFVMVRGSKCESNGVARIMENDGARRVTAASISMALNECPQLVTVGRNRCAKLIANFP